MREKDSYSQKEFAENRKVGFYIGTMSLVELEKEVENLDPSDFEAFTKWLDAYTAKRWDEQFEKDVENGKLDKLGKKADLAFESGQCTEL